MRRASYPAGTVLFRQGELPHEIWFLFAGAVKLAVDSGDGRRFIVRIAREGELLGLAPAFASCAHQTTAEAGAVCDVGAARSVEFLEFLEKYPEAFRAAAQEMGRAYNQTCMRLRIMGVHFRVTARMAGLLLEWAENGSDTERGVRIYVGLTHEEIGQCIGTTRETVSRILRELERRRIIETEGATLTILNRGALEECAGSVDEEQ
jgi:CRP-like cAMP-binding protein